MAFRLDAMTAASHIDSSAKADDDGSYSLFFFGTLVHPSILSKIIQNDGSHVLVQPAILPGYVVHHVVDEDYPGLIAKEQSDVIMRAATSNSNLEKEKGVLTTAQAVRGTLVRGLTSTDVFRLDAFEGDEYTRTAVSVVPDPTFPPLPNHKRPRDESIGSILSTLDAGRIAHLIEKEPSQPANVYLWRAAVSRLEAKEWDFATFTSSGKDKRWYA